LTKKIKYYIVSLL